MSDLPEGKPGSTPAGARGAGYSKSFEASQAVLLEELELAIRWGRPSILLAVYRSQDWQKRAEKALSQRLGRLGQKVVPIQAFEAQANVAEVIAHIPDREQTVFFVTGMEQAGQKNEISVYEALNINREFFVENQIRVVFWLTEKEALDLPRYAPDFWAFRHRVVEFTRPQTARQSALPAGLLLWHTRESRLNEKDLRAAIQLREKMLADLPQLSESLSSRLDLLYTLGYLYWSAGDTGRALEALTMGLALPGGAQIAYPESRLQEARAILDYDLGEYSKALTVFETLAANNPADALCVVNCGIAQHALGHNREAVSLGDQAVELEPKNPRLWNALGHLHLSVGETEPAIASFKNALELDPETQDCRVSLAVCYQDLGYQEEAKKQIDAFADSVGEKSVYARALQAAISGEGQEAVRLLGKALDAKLISASRIRHDPNISLLLDASQIASVLGEK
jgi:tetratricopeptide (TPR) repeat protein